MADPVQTVTGLEILDTAVKIGLGALISGIATYLVTKLNHDKKLEKQSIQRRRELLEQVSLDIERFWNSYRRYYLVSLEVIHRTKIGGDLAQEMRDEYEARKKKVLDSTDSLSSAQSSLLLLGLTKEGEILLNFARSSENYMQATKSLNTEKSIDELKSLHNQTISVKEELFSGLSTRYRQNNI